MPFAGPVFTMRRAAVHGGAATLGLVAPEVPQDGEARMTTSGTFLTSGLESGAPTTRCPVGVDVGEVALVRPTRDSPGLVEVALSGPVGATVYSLVLPDPAVAPRARALSLKPTASEPADQGARLTFTIPAGAELARPVGAVVVAGVFPLARATFP